MKAICDYYGLCPESGPISRLFARLVEGVSTPKRLFTVSEGVRALLRADKDRRLKVTAAGVKTFERQDQKSEAAAVAEANSKNPPCPFRVTHDGLALLAPLLRKQVVRPTALEMLALLEGRSVALAEEARVGLSEKEEGGGGEEKEGEVDEKKEEAGAGAGAEAAAAAAPAPQQHKHAGLWSDSATVAEVAACAIGGCVVCLRPEDAAALGVGKNGKSGGNGGENGSGGCNTEPDVAALATACWRGRASVTVHVTRNESSAYARRLRAALEAGGVEVPTPAPPAPRTVKTGSARDATRTEGGERGGAAASAPVAATTE